MSRDVFFLGAGFSKAINPSYPTLNELTAEINQNLNVEKESIYNHFRKEIPISYKNNIELLLNFLVSPLPYKTPAQIDSDNALYKNITTYISQYFKNKLNETIEFSKLHKNLAKFIKNHKCTCITLNYDTLLENLVYAIVSDAYKQANKNFSVFYKIPITELKNRIPDGYGCFSSFETDFHKTEMPEIIKLHGSINWLTAENTVFSETGDEDDYLRLGLENFIIPPTLDKTNLYNASFIKILWRKAFDVLTNAQNVYIIGFSFPPTDLAVRYLFQSALSNNNNNPNIYVINTKDAIDENSASYLKSRYDEIFNGCNLYYNYCCDNSLDNFIQEIINPKLNEVVNANN